MYKTSNLQIKQQFSINYILIVEITFTRRKCWPTYIKTLFKIVRFTSTIILLLMGSIGKHNSKNDLANLVTARGEGLGWGWEAAGRKQ